MFLVVCATEFELQPFLERVNAKKKAWHSLVTGVGMVETTLKLTAFLERQATDIRAVLNVGVGGAYTHRKNGAKLLEICLAEQEVFGDFGVCFPDCIEPLDKHLVHRSSYILDQSLLDMAEGRLREYGFRPKRGKFVTVCGVSGSESRGNMLGICHDGFCETMEGAAVARVCEEYSLPLLEIRVVSNYVEDRDVSRWKLSEACDVAGEAAAIVLNDFCERRDKADT